MPSTRRRRDQVKRFKQLTEAQLVLGWSVILILLALLGAIYLSQASSIAAVGRRVQFLQNELDKLKRENATLERQIAEAQSLERLEGEALRLGFTQAAPNDIEYIVVPNYPAATENQAEIRSAAASPPETIGELLWLKIQDRLNNLIYGEVSEQLSGPK